MCNDDDLRRIDEWRNGSISDAEFGILQNRLHEDAHLRAEMRAFADLDEGLRALAWEPIAISAPIAINATASPRPVRAGLWLPWTIAVAALVLAIIGWLPQTNAPKPASGHSVTALLVDEAGAKFDHNRDPGEVRFDPGHYELESGTVHLRFANGTDLIIHGPARFDIQDELHTKLEFGSVRAIVPPMARGFTVETRDISYEDIGTEFGLTMNAETNESTMYVFDGQVNLHRTGSDNLLKSVFECDAVRYRDGEMDTVTDVDLGQFPSPSEIGYLRWKSLKAEFLSDPSLIAWYPFIREDDPTVLRNFQQSYGVPDGNIVGAQWAAGRWASKESLQFDRDSDYVDMEIPGQYQELSIGVWLKVDRFDLETSAILNSNGADPGDVHLQMTRHGLPRGGVLGANPASYRWVGNPVPQAKWVYVTSVQSIPQRRGVIYVNGVRVWEVDLNAHEALIRPGKCRMGNWLSEGAVHGSSFRALRGRIDEVAIWNRALTPSEIGSLTEKGRPSLLWSPDNSPLRTPMPKPAPPL